MRAHMRLQNVNAVITGATSGIGQAVSSRFRREGANLLLTGRRPHPPEEHPDDVYLPGDLNDETFVSELADRAANHLGGVGVVVLCHGHQASSPLQDMSYADTREVLHGNLLSAFLVMKHLMPLAPEAGGVDGVCRLASRHGRHAEPDPVLRRQGRPRGPDRNAGPRPAAARAHASQTSPCRRREPAAAGPTGVVCGDRSPEGRIEGLGVLITSVVDAVRT
ncbi:SDR family NAD(P)-dependent oxidoreductase [Streptomyces sp. enrichment culture]|uniref:SDR family NAD(P)-dependent oxidoreductase n=1 Tax=Streptomyces sp. enrichment culture TaxID=1795815 RepID=UPI003F55464A